MKNLQSGLKCENEEVLRLYSAPRAGEGVPVSSVPHDAPSPRAHSSSPQSPGHAAGETACEGALTLCSKCISCPGSALAPRGFAVCFPIGDADARSVTASQQLPRATVLSIPKCFVHHLNVVWLGMWWCCCEVPNPCTAASHGLSLQPQRYLQ